MTFICDPPENITIRDAIKKVESGKWTLAPFQRPSKWSWAKQNALLESLLTGIPIGVVYLWEYKHNKDKVIPMRQIPGIDYDEENVEAMILDGQQRLSFLTWIFKKHQDKNFELGPGDIYFDASKGTFKVTKTEISEENGVFILNNLFKNGYRRKLEKNLEKNVKKLGKKYNIILRNISQMDDALNTWEIVTQKLLVGASMGESFRLYDTVNNAGDKLKGSDFVEAGIFSVAPKLYKLLQEEIKKLAEYPVNSGNSVFSKIFSRDNVIKCLIDEIYAVHNPNQRTSYPLKLLIDFESPKYSKTKDDPRPKTLSSAVINKAFKKVIDAFKHYKDIITQDMFITNEDGLSVTFSIPVNALLRTTGRKNDSFFKGQFIKWFISHHIAHCYTGGQDGKIKLDCSTAKESNPFPNLTKNIWRHKGKADNKDLIKKIKFTNSMYGTPGLKFRPQTKFLYHFNLMLAIYNNAHDWFEDIRIEDIQPRNELHKHHIFPKKLFDQKEDKLIMNHILNCARIIKRTNSSINAKEPANFNYLPHVLKINKSSLEAQQVPVKDNRLWKWNNKKTGLVSKGRKFMLERRELLVNAANNFLDKLEEKDWNIRNPKPSENTMNDKLKSSESNKLEFKETMLYMTKQEKGHKNFASTISKEVAGFLNSGGGDLFIGVKDKKEEKDRVIGLQRDFDWIESQNPECSDVREEWEKILTDRLRSDIGNTIYKNHIIRAEFVEVNKKTIYWITATYAGDKNDGGIRIKKFKRLDNKNKWMSWTKVLFIRIGTSSIPVVRLDNHKWKNDKDEIVNEDGTKK